MPNDLREQLAATGAQRQEHLANARDELTRIADLAREAQAQGIPKKEIAVLAGISRPTLDSILNSEP